MAAAKRGSAKGKGIQIMARGRMPEKRSINLVLINENRMNLGIAIPAIILILLLAAAFGKFLVYDRINAANHAEARVAQLRADVDEATELLNSFGDVEQEYAHYTVAGMSASELGQVDRVQVLELVHRVLIANATLSTREYCARLNDAAATLESIRDESPALQGIGAYIRDGFGRMVSLKQANSNEANTWSLSDNLLTINLSGRSLEAMNEMSKMLEQDPIVDTCVLSTASKSDKVELEKRVSARFIVYLRQAEGGTGK